MKRTVSVFSAALAALFLCGAMLAIVAPVQAQSAKRKPAVSSSRKKSSAKRKPASRRRSGYSSDAAKRAAALKKLNDYNYVKSMSPYRGSAYKWGSPW